MGGPRIGTGVPPALVLAVLIALAGAVPSARAADPIDPSTRPLPKPTLEAPEPLPELLPPIPPRRSPALDLGVEPELGLVVREWVFEGNTVFEDDELARVLAPWIDRRLSPAELQAARDAVTLHYVEAGYFTSGALIPDQEVRDGRVRVVVVEGELSEIVIEGNERFRDFYLRDRLALGGRKPLHVPTLERRVRMLQQDERIARIDAALRPGDELGQARLEVRIEEASPLSLEVETSNHMAPSLGDARGRLLGGHNNVAGLGDSFSFLVGGYEAGPELEARYRIPLNRYDTSIELGGRWTDSDLVEGLGEELDVTGEFWNFEVDLRQPVYRTPEIDLSVGTIFALRQSDTEIAGIEFNEVGDRTRVFVARVYQELLYRGRNQVFAARSTTHFGLPAFGSTNSDRGSIPDGRFIAWLAQMQWLGRFDPWGIELLLRGEVQLSEDPLLGLEQYALGGHATVRGYRENQLVRDQGYSVSAELRLPLIRDRVDRRSVLQLAPFFDMGEAWNRNRPTPGQRRLHGLGFAIRVEPRPFLRAELSWAHRFDDVDIEDGLQNDGVQFQIVMGFL